MGIKVALTIETFAQLIREHGSRREKASVTGRDCFEFKTAAGTYKVPTYEPFWGSYDFATFEAASGGDPVHQEREVLEQAVSDPAITALLDRETIEWTAGDH